jgi:hypothetical protein
VVVAEAVVEVVAVAVADVVSRPGTCGLIRSCPWAAGGQVLEAGAALCPHHRNSVTMKSANDPAFPHYRGGS